MHGWCAYTFKLEFEVLVAFSFQIFVCFFQLPISAPGAEKQFGNYNDNGFFFKAEST